MADKIELTYTSDRPQRLDAFLAQFCGASRTSVQTQIKEGRIRVNGQVVTKSGSLLNSGDNIDGTLIELEIAKDLVPVPADLDILFEDASLIVLNKPQGMVVHPAAGTLGSTLVHHLLHHLKDNVEFSKLPSGRPGIVHRLDRGTSGLLLVAKNGKSHENLSRQFHDRVVKKRYEAIVWGKLEGAGKIEQPISRSKSDPKRMSAARKSGKAAYTEWKSQEVFGSFSLLALFPRTGRTHQLRVHLSHLGYPIVGDDLYKRGSRMRQLEHIAPEVSARIRWSAFPYLHAQAISFLHPVSGEPLVFQAPRPANFTAFLELLREHSPSTTGESQ